MSSQDVIPCSVCVTAYNEEENIGSLLAALLDLHALFDLDPAAVTALTQTPEDLSDEPDDVSIHGEPGA